jgi:hypothetical protein
MSFWTTREEKKTLLCHHQPSPFTIPPLLDQVYSYYYGLIKLEMNEWMNECNKGSGFLLCVYVSVLSNLFALLLIITNKYNEISKTMFVT